MSTKRFPSTGDNEDSSQSPRLRHLRRISGIFEQTASDVRENASHVMSTIIVPASDSSQQYAAEQPVKATFLAMLTFFSFVPVLLFVVFAIAAVVFVTFSSISVAVTFSTLAFFLGAALLASVLLICVAPISFVFTIIAFFAYATIRFVQHIFLNGQGLRVWIEEMRAVFTRQTMG